MKWTCYDCLLTALARCAARSHFSVAPLRWQDVAFSDPTPDGLEFAMGVTGSQEFLVYNQ